jgi:hypothetical protein
VPTVSSKLRAARRIGAWIWVRRRRLIQLTDDGGVGPSSPDRTKVAFGWLASGLRQIWAMTADGSDVGPTN